MGRWWFWDDRSRSEKIWSKFCMGNYGYLRSSKWGYVGDWKISSPYLTKRNLTKRSIIGDNMSLLQAVRELVRNLVAHGDAREAKWRGNWRMEWVTSTLTPPPNVVYQALLKLMRTAQLPAVDWTDTPTNLDGLVRFGERRNLVFARVPSRSARAIHRLRENSLSTCLPTTTTATHREWRYHMPYTYNLTSWGWA